MPYPIWRSAEITTRGLPAILIPYPLATDNHQFKNAEILEKSGAAKLISDEDLSGPSLWENVSALIDHPDLLKEMASRSVAIGKPDAAVRAAELVVSLTFKDKG